LTDLRLHAKSYSWTGNHLIPEKNLIGPNKPLFRSGLLGTGRERNSIRKSV